MGCCETGHSHSWPTDGVLVIQRCEIRCNFCKGPKATKAWKYAWFLRRHVRAIHCKGGKGEGYDLQVSTQWKAPSDVANTPVKAEKSRKQSKKRKLGDVDEDDDEEEQANERAKPGAYSRGKSANTVWIPQPIYRDVPNQFPGMSGGFHPIDHQDVHFDQTLAFGDQDFGMLVDQSDPTSLINDDLIGQWLKSNLRDPVSVAADHVEAEVKEENDDSSLRLEDVPEVEDGSNSNLLLRTLGTLKGDQAAQQSAKYFNLNEDGEDVSPGLALDDIGVALDDRFFMSEYSEDSDIDAFLESDDALAQVSSVANPFNTRRPPKTDDALAMMKVLEATTDVMREKEVGEQVILHTYAQFARMLAQHQDQDADNAIPVRVFDEAD